MIKIRRYKRTQMYEVDITLRLPDGTQHRERKKSPVASVSGTRRWAEARERELLSGATSPKPKNLGPTLEKFWPVYCQSIKSDRQKHSTRELKESIYRNWLAVHLKGKRLGEIDNTAVAVLKTALQSSSRKHHNNVMSTLNTALKTAIDLGELDAMPCTIKLLRIPKDEHGFHEAEEYERLVKTAALLSPQHQLLVLLGGDAGLRLGEIEALEHQDIDRRRNIIHVRRAVYRGVVDLPKHNKVRRVPMRQRLAAALPRGVGRIFGGDDKALTRMLDKVLKAARIEGHPHKLRHTAFSLMAMRGVPLPVIQELAGHESIQTTMRYSHLSPTATASAIQLMDAGEMLETVKGSG